MGQGEVIRIPSQQRLSAVSRGYTSRWERAAAAYKRSFPLCLGCQAIGRSSQSEVVDHIRPHRGDQSLFWDVENWQPCCQWHHNTVKKRLERLLDEGLITAADLRLDSRKAMELSRQTKRPSIIGLDGWPA